MTPVRVRRVCAVLLGSAMVLLQPLGPVAASARTTPNYLPDAWIKLCGAGDTCKHAPPHPYKGEDIFNTTGDHQTVSARMEEGNNIRFWILLENDGALGDTFTVNGCPGNGAYVIDSVAVGALKAPQPAPHITHGFKNGTATFTFPPSSETDDVVLTLNILAKTTLPDVHYTCRILITSEGDSAAADKVVAKMVTV